MTDGRGRDPDGAPRLAELKRKVERATKLIAKLRETNYSLTGELAELQRRVSAFESVGSGESGTEADEAPPASETAPAPRAASESYPGGVSEELQALRDERKIIRAKVQSLLDRIEKLEL